MRRMKTELALVAAAWALLIGSWILDTAGFHMPAAAASAAAFGLALGAIAANYWRFRRQRSRGRRR